MIEEPLVRPPYNEFYECPACGFGVARHEKHCPDCGADLTIHEIPLFDFLKRVPYTVATNVTTKGDECPVSGP